MNRDIKPDKPSKASALLLLGASAAGGTIVFVTGGVVSVLLSYLPFSPLQSLATFIVLATTVGYVLNRVVARENIHLLNARVD
jgi:hypothetical protein